jgi:hypothetical protein
MEDVLKRLAHDTARRAGPHLETRRPLPPTSPSEVIAEGGEWLLGPDAAEWLVRSVEVEIATRTRGGQQAQTARVGAGDRFNYRLDVDPCALPADRREQVRGTA